MVCVIMKVYIHTYEREHMATKGKRRDIQTLLADYMNILPPGPQTAYVPALDNFSAEESWPVTPELEARMDPKSIIGETYDILNYALRELDQEHPEWYNGILAVFLHPEAGHSDFDFYEHTMMGHCAAEGVNWLAEFINDEDIFVRRSSVANTSHTEILMEDKLAEVAAAYERYIESGLSVQDAIENVALKYEKEFDKKRIKDLVKERVHE